jgi:SAM-dependent methyltransferase
MSAALAERALCKVWAVDASPEMVEVARSRVPAGVGVKVALAEDLPFRDGWFERVVLRLVLHLVDRPRALAEFRRVLAPGGRLALATFAPEHFSGFWLNDFFPSLEAIDRARFPTPDELERGARDAGFSAVRFIRLGQSRVTDRATALARIRGRHISTFDLLDEDEIRAGTERAARELPERVEYRLEWLIAVADV